MSSFISVQMCKKLHEDLCLYCDAIGLQERTAATFAQQHCLVTQEQQQSIVNHLRKVTDSVVLLLNEKTAKKRAAANQQGRSAPVKVPAVYRRVITTTTCREMLEDTEDLFKVW